LLPAVQSARAVARDVVCLSNLRQMGTTAALYREDFGAMPVSQATNDESRFGGVFDSNDEFVWSQLLVDYTEGVSLGVFTCPSQIEPADGQGNRMYRANARLIWGAAGKRALKFTPGDVRRPSDAIYVVDGPKNGNVDWGIFDTINESQVSNDWNKNNARLSVALRVHQGKFQILYLDTHVDKAPMASTEDAVWNWATDAENWTPDWASKAHEDASLDVDGGESARMFR